MERSNDPGKISPSDGHVRLTGVAGGPGFILLVGHAILRGRASRGSDELRQPMTMGRQFAAISHQIAPKVVTIALFKKKKTPKNIHLFHAPRNPRLVSLASSGCVWVPSKWKLTGKRPVPRGSCEPPTAKMYKRDGIRVCTSVSPGMGPRRISE